MSGAAGDRKTTLADIWDAEQRWVEARRRALAAEEIPCRAPDAARRVGLALSGGGIRSATFSLGLLQALSAARRLPFIDYLSTVSGGSYIGAFLGALFVDPARRGPDAVLSAEERRAFLADPLGCPRGRKAVARLREGGRYLTPGGASDIMYGASLIGRNWLMLQLLLGLLPLLVFLFLRLLPTLPAPGLKVADPSGSLYLFLVAAFFWLVSMGLALGYWFTRKEVGSPRLQLVAAFVVAVAGWGVFFYTHGQKMSGLLALSHVPLSVLPLLVLTVALVAYGLARRCAGGHKPPNGKTDERDEIAGAFMARQAEDRVRTRLTRWLATVNSGLVLLLALATLNLLGHLLRGVLRHLPGIAADVVAAWQRASSFWAVLPEVARAWPLLLLLLPFALTIWGHRRMKHRGGTGLLAKPVGQTIFGLSVLALWLAMWALLASLLAASTTRAGLGLYAFGVVLLFGGTAFLYGFINLSSLATLYAARLKRAYVGASNPHTETGMDVDNAGDLIPLETYYGLDQERAFRPKVLEVMRPVHLINATIAETIPGDGSKVVAYDRKGRPLHVSPAGIVSGSGIGDENRCEPLGACEPLALSDWTAISGAAAATAIGRQSTLGLSLLAMMTNVRLGYWWKPESLGRWSWPRSFADTVPGYLFSEMRMHFTASLAHQRRWYLTDGGHFENTGAYALLQRQLDFIIVADNGADPDYRFDDMMALVRKARTDLDTGIRFLEEDELDRLLTGDVRQAVGSYERLALPGRPYAALAEIRYHQPRRAGAPERGHLLLVKPTLSCSAPPDLLAYAHSAAGQKFPQQATLDQYFDEDQWEAYRQLGQLVGTHLFGTAEQPGFPFIEDIGGTSG